MKRQPGPFASPFVQKWGIGRSALQPMPHTNIEDQGPFGYVPMSTRDYQSTCGFSA